MAWPETAARLACPARLTGVPVRRGFAGMAPIAPAERRRLLVLGGSQGARELNRILPPALAGLAAEGMRLAVLHQTGAAHLEATRQAWEPLAREGLEVEVLSFVDDVAAALGEADLVVSRAGAITLAEICAAGRPALLVPSASPAATRRTTRRASRPPAAPGCCGRNRATRRAARRSWRRCWPIRRRSWRWAGRSASWRGRRAASAVAELVEEVAT